MALIAVLVIPCSLVSSHASAQSEPDIPDFGEPESPAPPVVQLPNNSFDPQGFVKPFSDPIGSAKTVLRFHPAQVLESGSRQTAMAISHDGSLMVAGGSDSSLKIWSLPNMENLKTISIPGGEFCGIEFDHQGRFVAATTAGGFYVFDAQSFEQVSNSETGINFCCLFFDGESMLSGSKDGFVHAWDLANATPKEKSTAVQEPIRWLSRAVDRSLTFAGTESGRLVIWESLDEFPEVKRLSNVAIQQMAFDSTGGTVATVDMNRRIRLQSTSTWATIWELPPMGNWKRGAVAFSSRGKSFVSVRRQVVPGEEDGQNAKVEIEVRDTRTGALVGQLLGQTEPMNWIEVSRRDDWVAVGEKSGEIRLWQSPFQFIEDYELKERCDELTEQIEATIAGNVPSVRLLQQRAFVNARLRRWNHAAEDFIRAKEVRPNDTMHWMRAGIMLLKAGDLQGYQEHTKEMLQTFEQPANAYQAERTAKLCVLPLEPVGEYGIAAELAAFGTQNSGESPWSMYFPTTEALVRYRYGEYATALEFIEKSRTRNRPGQRRPDVAEMLNHVIEALCWAATGDRTKAEAALKRADKYLAPFLDRPTSVDDSSQHDWLIGQMLYDEAKSLLQSLPADNPES